MRSSYLASAALVTVVAMGCAIPLDGERKSDAPATRPVAVSPACRLFQGGLTPSGAARSVARADGSSLWVLDGAGGDTALTNARVSVTAGARLDDCLASGVQSSTVATALVAEAGGASFSPMSTVSIGDDVHLFYQRTEPAAGEPFGVRVTGYGVARQEAPGGLFTPTPMVLWAGDGPSYGTAALVHDGFVYAFGCSPAGFLSASCQVARAPVASIDDEAAYTYYEGAGRWANDPARAWPVVEGAGTSLDVVWHPARQRFVMVYATILGTTLHARAGLSPQGPWSEDREIAGCDIAAPTAFCVGVRAHAELSPDRGHLAVTYVAGSLGGQPDDAWPRLTLLPLPDDMP